jgi:hypothetical protein
MAVFTHRPAMTVVRHCYLVSDFPQARLYADHDWMQPSAVSVEVAADGRIMAVDIQGWKVVNTGDGPLVTHALLLARYTNTPSSRERGLWNLPVWITPVVQDATARTTQQVTS